VKNQKSSGPRPEPPALQHFNVNQDHVTAIDHKKRMFADVYFREGNVCCQLCKQENCRILSRFLPKVGLTLTQELANTISSGNALFFQLRFKMRLCDIFRKIDKYSNAIMRMGLGISTEDFS